MEYANLQLEPCHTHKWSSGSDKVLMAHTTLSNQPYAILTCYRG